MAVFRAFRDEDYEAVCAFLIALSRENREHINWNWARFEWMYGHPEFDRSLRSAIGLWWDAGRAVGAAIYDMYFGAAIYDMYFGEAFCGVLPGYEALYPELLRYAWDALRDEAGLGIAIPDGCAWELAAAQAAGFVRGEQTETVMELVLNGLQPAALPDGFAFTAPDPVADEAALAWLFWRGFEHGEDRAEFEAQPQAATRPRPHFRRELGVAAADAAGELAALCCLWYHEGTDYAYVEPVCTVPSCRGRGVGRAVVTQALARAAALGARRAYVISDQRFYERLGFRKTCGYTFYFRRT